MSRVEGYRDCFLLPSYERELFLGRLAGKEETNPCSFIFILEILFRRRRSLEIAFQIAIVKWEDNKNRHFNFPIVIRTNGLRIQTNGDKYQFISLKFNNFI